jgi:hypothetical protein
MKDTSQTSHEDLEPSKSNEAIFAQPIHKSMCDLRKKQTNILLLLTLTPMHPPPTLIMMPASPPMEPNRSQGLVTTWPTDSELLFPNNTGKLRLTFQYDLVCIVIQDSFVNVHTALIFEHTFLDISLSQTFVQDALLLAAKGCMPSATLIHAWLQQDAEYLGKITPLVSLIPLYFQDNLSDAFCR